MTRASNAGRPRKGTARSAAARAVTPASVPAKGALSYENVSEKEWQQQVRELLRLNGWQSYHTFDSRRSDPGWPDIVALHPRTGDLFVAELKSEYASATPEQLAWLEWFGACGIDAYLFKPSMIDEVIARVSKAR